MNFESNLISHILNKNDTETFERIQSSFGDDLFLMYKAEIMFISKFYKEYNKLPALETFVSKFPNLEIKDNPEPVEFYLDRLRDAYINSKMIDLNNDIIEAIENKKEKPINEIKEFLKVLETSNYKSKDINIRDNLDERLDKYNELRDGKLLKGIPTGFDKIDSETGGIFNTDFVVLFGKAKSFKTFLLITIALNSWRAGHNVIFYSREMGAKQMLRRIDAVLTGYNPHALKMGSLDDEKFCDFTNKLRQTFSNPYSPFFYMIDVSGIEDNTDVTFIKQKIKEYNPDISFIDGLYLFSAEGKSEWEKVKNVTNKIKQITIETNKPIFVTTQATRTKKGVLTRNDVAFSNSFIQDCDLLLSVNRMYDKITESESNKIMVEALAGRDVDTFKFYLELTESLGFLEVDDRIITEQIASYDFDTPF